MKRKCLACGVEKDTSVKEVYPYPDDGFIEEPIRPLMQIDCQGTRPYIDQALAWRVVTVCHVCFHKLDPDMWINDEIWESIKPVTPFEQLPNTYWKDGA